MSLSFPKKRHSSADLLSGWSMWLHNEAAHQTPAPLQVPESLMTRRNQRLTSLHRWWFFQSLGWGRGTSPAWEEPTADQRRRSGSWIPHHQSCSVSGRSWGNQTQRRSWHGRPGSLERGKYSVDEHWVVKQWSTLAELWIQYFKMYQPVKLYFTYSFLLIINLSFKLSVY